MADKIIRITLFPPSGRRIAEIVKAFKVDGGILKYTGNDGISYETSLPFAAEYIEEGHKKTPFWET